ncbi:MAG: tetratricopeptide repeat protein [Vicinamibacterales bacterium]
MPVSVKGNQRRPTLARLVVHALAWGVVLLTAAPAAAAWTRMSSPHFSFVGDASERQMRAIAQRLERFRAVMARLLTDGDIHSGVPTVVVVFRNDRSFTPFKPVFDGKPVSVAGYFVGTGDIRYIAVNAEQDVGAYGVIFHEYTHALLADAIGRPPAWLDEGLAGFYETFDLNAADRSAVLGVPNAAHLRRLQSTPLLPVAKLVDVDKGSALYNSDEQRSLFYAQSWALVHYLTFADASRASRLQRYMSAIRQGESPSDAFMEIFGADVVGIDADLQRYVVSQSLKVARVDASETAGDDPEPKTESIGDHEAAGYLGDMLARLGRTTAAREYLEGALAARPEAALATGALGQLELDAGNLERASMLLERAAALAPNSAVVQGAFGRALVAQGERGGPDADARYERARSVLAHAVDLEPSNVPAAVMLAALEMIRENGGDRPVTLMRRVVRSVPGRENYRLMLARALAMAGEYQEASELLAGLASRGSTADMRAAAGELLAQVTAVASAPRSGAGADPRPR